MENSDIGWKAAAKMIGMSHIEYTELRERGLKRCYYCKTWVSISKFGTDRSRGDNLASTCKSCRTKKDRGRNRGVSIEQRRAHRLIQMRVLRGKLENPNLISCMDCGHTGSDRRHEYDHYLGYEGINREMVQAVCTLCHVDRHKERKQCKTQK